MEKETNTAEKGSWYKFVVGFKLMLIGIVASIILLIPNLFLTLLLGQLSAIIILPLSFFIMGFLVVHWKEWLFR